MPVHLRPSAPTAPAAHCSAAIPRRALTIAQRVLVQPRMSNHHRGLWGYYGETASGAALTVQATGIGGPSAAIVLDELAELGLRRAIRVGTCAAPGRAPAAGTGARRRLGDRRGRDQSAAPRRRAAAPRSSPTLSDGRSWSGVGPARPPPSVSRDLHRPAPGPPARSRPADLQTAATARPFLPAARGRRSAAVLAVAERSAGRRLEDEPLEAALLRLAGRRAAAASRDDLTSLSWRA